MKYAIKVTYNLDENEYMVFVEGLPELYGRGETESGALLDFLQKYETNYSGYKCFNQHWVQQKIAALTLVESYEA